MSVSRETQDERAAARTLGRYLADEGAPLEIRKALAVLMSGGPSMGGWRLNEVDHHRNCATGKREGCDCYAEPHQPGRDALASLVARLERVEEAHREILKHTGGPNVWNEDDGCQLWADGHDNCRPVIFALARDALGSRGAAIVSRYPRAFSEAELSLRLGLQIKANDELRGRLERVEEALRETAIDLECLSRMRSRENARLTEIGMARYAQRILAVLALPLNTEEGTS